MVLLRLVGSTSAKETTGEHDYGENKRVLKKKKKKIWVRLSRFESQVFLEKFLDLLQYFRRSETGPFYPTLSSVVLNT